MKCVQGEVLGGLWQLRCTRSLCRTYNVWIPSQVPWIIWESQALPCPIAASGPPRFVIPTSHFIGKGGDTEEPVFNDYMATN